LIPQNEPVDIAFGDAGAWSQFGLVVGVGGGELVVGAVAVQAGDDLGELGDVAGVRVQGRAVLPGPGGLVLFLVVEVVRVGEDPAGQVAGPGGPAGGAGFPEGKDGRSCW
jgi:hypothetical protein